MNDSQLRSLSIHEMSHFHVATMGFGIPATARIVLDELENVTEAICIREFSGPDFAAAAVGWAGVVGEHLLDCVDTRRTPLVFPLTETTIEKWHFEVLFHAGELSDTDESHLRRFKPTLAACQFAFRILSKDLAGLSADAERLADRTRKTAEARWQGVPKPENNSTTLADFLRLVVTGEEAEKQFSAFVRATQVKFFSNLQLSPEHREEGIENWTRLRLESFQKGFPDAAIWRSTALAFKQWVKTSP